MVEELCLNICQLVSAAFLWDVDEARRLAD
jgi:hypothetical protein